MRQVLARVLDLGWEVVKFQESAEGGRDELVRNGAENVDLL